MKHESLRNKTMMIIISHPFQADLFSALKPSVRHLSWKWLALLLLFTGFPFLGGIAQEQENFDFKYVEQKSYKLYSTGQWPELITFGKKAIKQGHDYYYLRLRLGLAYFNEQNYYLAALHLQKAHSLNTSESLPIQYLYLSYVYSNRTLAAHALDEDHPEFLKEITANQRLLSNQIYFESGTILSNNITNNKKSNPAGDNGILGIQDMNGNKSYGHLAWKGITSKNVSLYLGLDFLNTDKMRIIQSSELAKTGYDTILYNGWYYVDTLYGRSYETREYPYQLKQRSIYAQAQFELGKGFSITPAARFLFVNYTTQEVKAADTLYFAQSYDSIPSISTTFNSEQQKTNFANYVFSLSLSKVLKNFDYSVFGSYSRLNDEYQKQLGLGLIWFPLGNLNLYSQSRGIAHFEAGNTAFGFDQMIGLKIANKLWVEGSITLGQWDNFTLDHAFVVYNSGDKNQLRFGTNFILPLSNHLELSARYQYLKLNGTDIWYDENMEINTSITTYNNNLIIGGIQWKF